MVPESVSALASSEFTDGIVAGGCAIVVVLLLRPLQAWRRASHPAGVAGVVFAAGALGALSAADRSTPGLPVAIAMLALGGALTPFRRRSSPAYALAALPGALLLSRTVDAEVGWVEPFVVLAAVLGGWAVADFDRRFRGRGLGPALLAVSFVGVYLCVPDTEEALVLVGVAVVLVLVGWPLPLDALGPAGAYALAGLLAWTAAVGGVGRPSSIVGAVACVGMLAAEPLTTAATRRTRSAFDALPRGRFDAVAAALLQLVVVLAASRLVGTRQTVAASATLAALLLLVTGTALIVGASAASGRRTAGAEGMNSYK